MSGYDASAHADVYLTTFAAGRGEGRVLWRMTVADAQAVCEQPETAGTANYGGRWMLCWTARELVEPHWDSFMPDDGRFTELFARLGVTVLMSRATLLDGTAILPAPAALSKPRTDVVQLDLFGEAA